MYYVPILDSVYKGLPIATNFPATGCATLSPPDGAWLQRDGDNLVIRCNETGETWYLSCQGDEWIGEYNKCSDHEVLNEEEEDNEEDRNFLQQGNVKNV